MADSDNDLSFIETQEERERGTYVVVIKAIRANGFPKKLVRQIASQKAINQIEAEEAVEALAYGKIIECRFSDLFKARLFSLATEMVGAVCDFDE